MSLSVVIPDELLEAIETRVQFDSESDRSAFVLDALQTYTELGALAAQNGELKWHPADGSTPRRVRLPFQQQGGDGGDGI